MTKKVEITEEEFIKKVQIEASYLHYMDHMKKHEAKKAAEKYVGDHFKIKEK